MTLTDIDDLEIVVGGVGLSKADERHDIIEPMDMVVSDETDRRIVRLLMLHQKLRVKFRNQDLSALDRSTKQALLDDMYDVLGIARLADER